MSVSVILAQNKKKITYPQVHKTSCGWPRAYITGLNQWFPNLQGPIILNLKNQGGDPFFCKIKKTDKPFIFKCLHLSIHPSIIIQIIMHFVYTLHSCESQSATKQG